MCVLGFYGAFMAHAWRAIIGTMEIMGVNKFERLFRAAAELDVDKEDLKRYGEFVNKKILDLLLQAQTAASANGRDIIQPYDLPITKGLEHCMFEFRDLDEQLGLVDILDELTARPRPQIDLDFSDDTDSRLPQIAGGLAIALARAFKLLDPNVKNPQTAQWERAFKLFDLLL